MSILLAATLRRKQPSSIQDVGGRLVWHGDLGAVTNDETVESTIVPNMK